VGSVSPDHVKTCLLQSLLNFERRSSHSAPRENEKMNLYKDTAQSGVPQRLRHALRHVELSSFDTNFYNSR
jgi:hypothetical protein